MDNFLMLRRISPFYDVYKGWKTHGIIYDYEKWTSDDVQFMKDNFGALIERGTCNVKIHLTNTYSICQIETLARNTNWSEVKNLKIDSVLGGITFTPPFSKTVSVADVIYKSWGVSLGDDTVDGITYSLVSDTMFNPAIYLRMDIHRNYKEFDPYIEIGISPSERRLYLPPQFVIRARKNLSFVSDNDPIDGEIIF